MIKTLRIKNPRFKLENVRVLHLEPTSRCNAACPQCSRFLDDGITIDPSLQLVDLPLETVQRVLSTEFVLQLKKMFMCGNYGDPAASIHTLQIYDWFREINPSIELGMNTNGSLKTASWWSELGTKIYKEKDFCIFSIDGLQDTNHIYRRNTNFDKIINNAQSFIAAGGRAVWDMLIFKHNEHQVETTKQLAKELGFVQFRAKVSRRFLSRAVDGIEPPTDFNENVFFTNEISCQALRDGSLYMDHLGRLVPCCYIGDIDNKLTYTDFPNIINSWKTSNPLKKCVNSCSIYNKKTNFIRQWVYEEKFK